MQAPDISPTGEQDEDDGKVVMVLEICTERGVHFNDAPRRLEDVILADYISREGPIAASEREAIREMLAYDTQETLEDRGFLGVMDSLLYDDGDYIVVDAGEGVATYCLENDIIFKSGPDAAN